MNKQEMSNAYAPKTLFAFSKENEAAVLANVNVSTSCEKNGIVYATMNCSKDKADLSSIKHLLIGPVTGA